MSKKIYLVSGKWQSSWVKAYLYIHGHNKLDCGHSCICGIRLDLSTSQVGIQVGIQVYRQPLL